MADLKDLRFIYLKGVLFFVGGLLALAIILLEHPDLKLAGLLALAIWCFARCYYFAFYVIEHYVDSCFKYAGLWSFVKYLAGKKQPTSDVSE